MAVVGVGYVGLVAAACLAEGANYAQQDRFAARLLDYFGDKASETTMSVCGLAFKARTDDVRESPAIRCMEKLPEAGIKVKAYDPEAMEAARQALGGRIETKRTSYDALDGADALVIFTEWQEFRNPDFDAIKDRLKNAVIFDGRNLYDPGYVRKKGIEYHCIGRP